MGPPTLEAQLPPDLRAPLGGTAFFCVNPGCPTGYFNAWGAAVPAERLASRAWPKDPEAPICPCFGITADEIASDARDGKKERVRDLVERAKGAEARCRERCPDGRPCIPRVLRHFREAFGG